MRNIKDQITVGDLKILILDGQPTSGGGVPASVGSLAMVLGSPGIYQKMDSSDSSWSLVSIASSDLQDIASGLSGRLSVLEADPVTKTYVDAADSSLQAGLAQEVSDRQSAVLAEAGLRVSGDQGLSDRLDALQTEVDGIELDDTTFLKLDGTRPMTGGLDLGSHKISGVSDGVNADEAVNKSQLDAEESRAMGVESGLRSDLTQEISDRESAVSAEQSRAEGEEERIEGKIDQEVIDRGTAITNLQSSLQQAAFEAFQQVYADLATETSARISADSTESSARTSADNAEQAARIAADNAEQAARMAADDVLDGKINDEESARIAADQNLQSQINNIVSNVDPAALDSLTEVVAAFQAADGNLNDAISALSSSASSGLSAEQTAREAADDDLQSQIDAEESARIAADNALDARLDVLEADPVTKAYVDAEDSTMFKKDGSRAMTGNILSGVAPNPFTGTGLDIGEDGPGAFRKIYVGRVSTMDVEAPTDPFTGQPMSLNVHSQMGMNSKKISGLANGVNADDAVNKGQLDALESALNGDNSGLQSQLTQEIADRIADVNAEESRAMGEESRIEGKVDQEVLDRQADVDAEETRAMGEEARIEGKIDQEISDRLSAVSAEAALRVSGDETLDDKIDQEISDRQTAITNLQNTLEENATIAFGQVFAAITAEQNRAQGEESRIEGLLNAEISNREADVDTEQARAEGEESRIEGRLDQEILDRQSGDSSTLSSAQSYTDQKVADLVNSAPAVLDTLKELADALGDDPNFATTVSGQIGAVDDKVDQEIIDRQTAITNLQSTLEAGAQVAFGQVFAAISAEESARQSADTSLRNDLNAEISRAQAEEALKLNKAGDSMTGDLDMGSNDVKNVGALGLGTSSPETIFEMVDNGVKYNMSGHVVSTSGTEEMVVGSFEPASNSVELVKVFITGYDSSYNFVSYERTVRVKNVSGTVSLGTVQSDYTSEDSSLESAECSFNVNSSSVEVKVKGAGVGMDWKCVIHRMR